MIRRFLGSPILVLCVLLLVALLGVASYYATLYPMVQLALIGVALLLSSTSFSLVFALRHLIRDLRAQVHYLNRCLGIEE